MEMIPDRWVLDIKKSLFGCLRVRQAGLAAKQPVNQPSAEIQDFSYVFSLSRPKADLIY